MSWTHLRDTTPKARKQYRCFLCGEAIPIGERYICRSGISDGGLDTFRMHAECEKATKGWDEMDWESFSEGDMPRGNVERRDVPIDESDVYDPDDAARYERELHS